ncbi:MAG: DoxX family membrane protein [Candidatus Marinimicrobia bacterium]|jgi:uncharacterized membrane protein YphA (DoxX/SURF4 family)|nr:DoxX family membrane protein [Candidatus Neomarinimicrobiota bacterium]MBT3691726.1 DoxX family membrane protein [Candidatus Neomarinimicrobiota bacterium]MBT4593228.1 DoxX family membrane protein [Candidatus Neomarinimicrobiota bacterium]MBT4991729.1 DoxX family membrane protein [Candidatus Neomarinimicrobiota bacterium]MBT5355444.1 DoxX family membrane protein [Candidatus Neomarinimicrobiota bacterium]
MKVNKYIQLLIRLIIGGLFIYASLDKIENPDVFAQQINNYHLVPFGLENIIAIVLPWLEFITGIGLIVGVYLEASALWISILLLSFIVMMIQAILRGYNIECGCGLNEGEMVGAKKIIENMIILGALVWLMIQSKYYFTIYPKTALEA